MSVAKSIEISAQSPKSFDDAIQRGVKKAQASVDHLKSVWIENQEVLLDNSGNIGTYKVWMKATFELN